MSANDESDQTVAAVVDISETQQHQHTEATQLVFVTVFLWNRETTQRLVNGRI